jgi:hypothetical protein
MEEKSFMGMEAEGREIIMARDFISAYSNVPYAALTYA